MVVALWGEEVKEVLGTLPANLFTVGPVLFGVPDLEGKQCWVPRSRIRYQEDARTGEARFDEPLGVMISEEADLVGSDY